jgi:signal peptidase I
MNPHSYKAVHQSFQPHPLFVAVFGLKSAGFHRKQYRHYQMVLLLLRARMFEINTIFMFLLVYLLVLYVLTCFTLKPLFEKAGVSGSQAWIPGVNFATWRQLLGQARSKAWWLLFPIANIFSFAGMCVDLVRAFGYMKFWHSALAVVFPPAIFAIIGRDPKAAFTAGIVPAEKKYRHELHEARKGKDKRALEKLTKSPFHKPVLREWTEYIVFAVFAASFIRMFLIEAYVIPTSSMEGSLLVGDYLFVSKAHYGIRTPSTVLQLPLMHNRIPVVDRESYLAKPALKYYRLPAFQKIKQNEPVVFNLPEGDSMFVNVKLEGYTRNFSIYQLRASNNPTNQRIMQDYPLTVRPFDKCDHYIKRCVGLAGDTLQIKDNQLYINGKPALNPSKLQFNYQVRPGRSGINPQYLTDLGVNINEARVNQQTGSVYMALSESQASALRDLNDGTVVEIDSSVFQVDSTEMNLFPRDIKNFGNWTVANYGPLVLPARGMTMTLTPQNISLYRRAITAYEGNTLEERGGKFYINGQETTSYTFRYDYFWMMGDNRHNSEDSRFWGFVPETHVVGKPLIIWFSTKNASIREGIKFNRIFTTANKM